MDTAGWLSLLPPVGAIGLALITRQVFVSLFAGIWLGWAVLKGGPLVGLVGAVDACISVFGDAGNTKIILFCALVGALIAFTQRSGGIDGLVVWFQRHGFGATRRRAQLWAIGVGAIIFVESSITCLVTGTLFRPLFDDLRISREKLAYLLDSTSAPICILIPLNAWGAYIIGLLANEGVEEPLAVFVSALPLNFYAIVAFFGMVVLVILGRDFGPMARAEARADQTGQLIREGAQPMVSEEITGLTRKQGAPARAINVVVPIAVLVLMMPIGLYLTGDGDLMAGSGSTSVFWSVVAALCSAGLLYRGQGILSTRELRQLLFTGTGGLLPLALLMVLAFAIGSTCKALGTGLYVVSVTQSWLEPGWIAPLLFLIGAFTAFSTGTSWGTFATLIPIAVPMAAATEVSLPMALAAVLSGGVFGDHCSPISDTSVVSSMSAACDHVDHVRTQLPYAAAAGVVACALFAIAGS